MLRILGPLEINHQGRDIRLAKPKLEGMLAVLLLEAGRVVPLRKLAEAIWDDPPATALHQLRKLAGELRRTVPTDLVSIVTDRRGYRAVVAPDQFDLPLFEEHQQLAAEAESGGDHDKAVSELRAGLALWRGPVAAGMGNLFLRSRADVLDEGRISAQARLLTLRPDSAEASSLVAELSTMLAEHPLHEKLRALTMTALYRSGRQSEALKHYHEGRTVLAETFGVDPGPELREVYEGIIHADTALHGSAKQAAVVSGRRAKPERSPWAVSAQVLPRDLSDFTGRTAELGRLLETATRPPRDRPSTLVVDGMAGVGKTALAVHLAHRITSLYPDGVHYADLHGFTAGRPATSTTATLRTLLGRETTSPRHDADEMSFAWREHITGRRALIVLDNAVDAAQVLPLLPRSSDSLTIITTRTPMHDLDGATGLTLTPLGNAEAGTLLTRIIGEGRLDDDGALARQLADLCGGLPLALRIIAVRLSSEPHLDVASLLGALADLGSCLRHLVLGPWSVEVAFARSYERVPRRAQSLLCGLAELPNPVFDTESARSLDESAGPLLEQLRDERLLVQHGLDSYGFHTLVRAFARSVRPLTAAA